MYFSYQAAWLCKGSLDTWLLAQFSSTSYYFCERLQVAGRHLRAEYCPTLAYMGLPCVVVICHYLH